MQRHIYKDNTMNMARRRLSILWATLLFGFLVFPYLTNSGSTGYFGCSFHQLTGLSCPTCGMSRSLYELSQFNILESFKMHLLGPVIYLLAVILFIKLSIEVIIGATFKFEVNSIVIKRAFVAFGVIWVVYWLTRMALEIIHI